MSDERAAELCGATDHAFMNCMPRAARLSALGGVHILVAVAAEFVSTGIFEGEPENIGPFVFLVVCRIRLGGMQPAESGTHE